MFIIHKIAIQGLRTIAKGKVLLIHDVRDESNDNNDDGDELWPRFEKVRDLTITSWMQMLGRTWIQNG